MSEIEKAREALYAKLDGDVTAPWSVVEAVENLVVAAMTEYGNRIREIAREEIEANEGRLMYEAMHGEINQEGGEAHSPGRHERPATGLDKSPPAVEAPAAGDSDRRLERCPYCGGTGRFQGKFGGPGWPQCPRCYGTGKAQDVSPRNAVEAAAMGAAAAGDLRPLGGITIRADEPNIVVEGLGRPDLSIGSELSDTTALARRLAEALKVAWDVVTEADELAAFQILDALTEARKAGLIE